MKAGQPTLINAPLLAAGLAGRTQQSARCLFVRDGTSTTNGALNAQMIVCVTPHFS